MAAEILLGTQGWSYPDWIGTFYPPGTRAADFLKLYSQTFPTVELDSTFYGAPRPSQVDAWPRRTPPGFKLAAKLPQTITHEKRLENVRDELFSFLDAITRLAERLGPILAQCPPDLRAGDAERAALASF